MAYGSMASGYWREKSHRRAIAVRILVSSCDYPGHFTCSGWLTKVLHILVGDQCQWAAWLLARLCACAVSLEDYYAVGGRGCDEGGAIAELGPPAVVLEEDVTEAVAERAEEQCHMADEPRKLQRLC